MDSSALDKKIRERGREFFASISGEAPSIFNKGWWTGKVMDWSMKNENFKVQLFRFVDVLPYLNTSDSLTRLDSHLGVLAERLEQSENADFSYTPLAEHLDEIYGRYVMTQQRETHAQATGSKKASATDLPGNNKIELF